MSPPGRRLHIREANNLRGISPSQSCRGRHQGKRISNEQKSKIDEKKWVPASCSTGGLTTSSETGRLNLHFPGFREAPKMTQQLKPQTHISFGKSIIINRIRVTKTVLQIVPKSGFRRPTFCTCRDVLTPLIVRFPYNEMPLHSKWLTHSLVYKAV